MCATASPTCCAPSWGGSIAEIVPEVRERLPDVGSPAVVEDPRQARFRLFDSIAGFLRQAGRSQPLVLILEDLHWADTDSLGLLEFVARELAGARVLVLGNYRDVEVTRQHPLSRTLAELTREHLAKRIVLDGLSEQEVARFVEAISGIAPPAELVEAVHTQTEGNPLFVSEILRLLEREGALTPERLETRESWSVASLRASASERALAALAYPGGVRAGAVGNPGVRLHAAATLGKLVEPPPDGRRDRRSPLRPRSGRGRRA